MNLNLLILILFFSISCSDKSTGPGDAGTIPEVVTETTLVNGIKTKANNAFGSTASTISSLAFSNLFSSVTCSNSGSPTSTSAGASDYASALTYCQFNTNSGSPDTIRGSYSLILSIMCGLEKQIKFKYNATYYTHENVVLPGNDDCLSGTSDYPYSSDFKFTIKERKINTLSDWSYEIKMDLNPGSTFTPDYIILLKDTTDVVGAKIAEYSESNSYWTGLSLIIDTKNSKVFFETFSPNNTRHIRVAIQGTMSSSGNFSNVSRANLIHSDNGREVIMDFNGTHEYYDYYESGSQDSDYPRCNNSTTMTDCTNAGLGITYSSSFKSFTSNQSALDSKLQDLTEMYLNFTFPINMSSYLP